MNLHRIADLTVDMGYKYDRMKKQADKYRISENASPQITIYLSDSFLERKNKENPQITPDMGEYIYTGSIFYAGLILFGGFMLHASAVLMDGRAYLFSASSGVGKSTHTAMWQKVFGRDRAKILNDDKPALRIEKDGIYAFGTPWSGKTDLNINVKAPVTGICFIERGKTNKIRRENGAAVIGKMLAQTIRPYDKKDMELLLSHIDKVLCEVPVYTLSCDISEEAVYTAYNAMSKGAPCINPERIQK